MEWVSHRFKNTFWLSVTLTAWCKPHALDSLSLKALNSFSTGVPNIYSPNLGRMGPCVVGLGATRITSFANVYRRVCYHDRYRSTLTRESALYSRKAGSMFQGRLLVVIMFMFMLISYIHALRYSNYIQQIAKLAEMYMQIKQIDPTPMYAPSSSHPTPYPPAQQQPLAIPIILPPRFIPSSTPPVHQTSQAHPCYSGTSSRGRKLS